MNSKFKGKGRFVFFPIVAIAFFLAGGYAVMLLWNAIIPDVFGNVKTLTYSQATGLLVLVRILFGGFRGRGNLVAKGTYGGPPWRERLMNMNEEEREKFKKEWRERCEKK